MKLKSITCCFCFRGGGVTPDEYDGKDSNASLGKSVRMEGRTTMFDDDGMSLKVDWLKFEGLWKFDMDTE